MKFNKVKLVLTAMLIVLPLSPADTYDELRINAANFERHYDPFVRQLFGCPPEGPTNKETCTFPAYVNYAEFQKARSAASKLFDLKEP